MKSRNSSTVFLFMKYKCDNFACVMLDQQDKICALKEFQRLIFSWKLTFQKVHCSRVLDGLYVHLGLYTNMNLKFMLVWHSGNSHDCKCDDSYRQELESYLQSSYLLAN